VSARPRGRAGGRADKPLRRGRVLLGTLVAVVALAGIVGLAEALRPPPGPSTIAVADERADLRAPLHCPTPAPPDERDDDAVSTLQPARPPVAVSSSELLDCPHSFDRRRVRYRGEAVGGVLRREGGAWAQINDDVYAGPAGPLPGHRSYRGHNAGIGVFLPDELADELGTVGGPGAQGDLVEVVGVFRRVDPGSQEVAVIRAASVEVLRAGAPRSDPPLRDRQVAAAVLAALALATAGTERLIARRRERG